MKYAVIDIGSNSICLVAYEINENNFKTLFKEKIMAGLAGYVKKVFLPMKASKKPVHHLTNLSIYWTVFQYHNVPYLPLPLYEISQTQKKL